jgi:glc operon protein GlcG
MKTLAWAMLALTVVGMCGAGAAVAQQQTMPQNPLDLIPEKMPFSIPYGTPITLQRAQEVIQAAVAEANKRGWQMDIAVVDPAGDLVTFVRMDGAQLASIAIAQHKAAAAARFRRPTRIFEDLVQKGVMAVTTIDGVITLRGGIPLVDGGKLIGAIGCSGGAGSQDEVVCTAAADTINK